MDISDMLFNAVRRNGAGIPIELDYPDLLAHQRQNQSRRDVLMLDAAIAKYFTVKTGSRPQSAWRWRFRI